MAHFDSPTATALLVALRLADEHGGAEAALRATGVGLPDMERLAGLSDELGVVLGGRSADEPVSRALALGFLAGRVAVRPRARTVRDPTSFVMDRELVVQGAEGQSILRLPWFEEELFVGRQVPHISEMPPEVRMLCVEHYSAALAGDRGRFAFTSYGHEYWVDAVPVRGDDGRIEAVLAIATPAGARRSVGTPSLTPRELQVLELASHGHNAAGIAEQLVVSVGTVKTHLGNIYPKLGVNDRAAAVAAAIRHGLIR